MKMHPKPMVRHTWPVITCTAKVLPQLEHPLPVHLVLTIDGRTQRVCMSGIEARALADDIIAAANAD